MVPQGRFAEAIRELEMALEQDPLSTYAQSVLAVVLAIAGDYDRAIAEANKALELDPAMWIAWLAIAWANAFRGMFVEAREPAEKVIRLAPQNLWSTGMLAGILSGLGQQEQASELIAPCRQKPEAMWVYHLLRSDFDAALEAYQAALALRDRNAVLFAAAHVSEPLRQSPRWPAIARKLNLPTTQ
jgi:Flp pilus assembly protein TadD